jgi:hypothetical protein
VLEHLLILQGPIKAQAKDNSRYIVILSTLIFKFIEKVQCIQNIWKITSVCTYDRYVCSCIHVNIMCIFIKRL